MGRHALWIDVRRSIRHSKGRFLSIVGLMALGSFALVGLFVAGPDMRATGAAFFDGHHAADLMVIGDFGLNDEDCDLIRRASDIDALEFGYLRDVTIDGTDSCLRIQSAPEPISRYEVEDGRMPETADEIALDAALEGDYELGDSLTLDEGAEGEGDEVFVGHDFTVVGFVSSCEIISHVNMGSSTAGSGKLDGYGVVVADAFDSDVYMTARLTFSDTAGLDPYSDEYADRVHAHRDELEDLLADQPGVRLSETRAEGQEAIDDGQREVDEGWAELDDVAAQLIDARAQLDDAGEQVAESEIELADKTSSAEATIESGEAQLSEGRHQLAAAKAELEAKEAELSSAREALASGEAQLESARQELERKRAEYESAAAQRPALEAAIAQLDEGAAAVSAALSQVGQVQLDAATASALVSQQTSALFSDGAPAETEASHAIYMQLVALEGRLGELGSDATPEEVGAVLADGLTGLSETIASPRAQASAALDAIDAASAQIEAAHGRSTPARPSSSPRAPRSRRESGRSSPRARRSRRPRASSRRRRRSSRRAVPSSRPRRRALRRRSPRPSRRSRRGSRSTGTPSPTTRERGLTRSGDSRTRRPTSPRRASGSRASRRPATRSTRGASCPAVTATRSTPRSPTSSTRSPGSSRCCSTSSRRS